MLEHVLVLSAYLFSIGIYGLITSRNMVRALMCLELILNAVNINLVTFSDFFYNCRPIHDFLLIFLGIDLILGGLGVVFFTNPIYSAFSLGLVFVCISLFYILSNSHFVAVAQLLIYVGAINVLILFAVMLMNGSEYYKDFNLFIVGNGVTSLV